MKPYVDGRKQKTDWYGKYVFYIPLELHCCVTTNLFLRNIANTFYEVQLLQHAYNDSIYCIK